MTVMSSQQLVECIMF